MTVFMRAITSGVSSWGASTPPGDQERCALPVQVCSGDRDGGSLGPEWGQAGGVTSTEQSGNVRPEVRLEDKAELFC